MNWIDPWGLWKWYEEWWMTFKEFPKAWSDVVTEKTDKAKQEIELAWEKHQEFHKSIRESFSKGENSDFVGYEYMTGYEVTGLGIGLTGFGVKGILGGTLTGVAAGGFWAIIGVEVIWVGFDIFQGIQDRKEEDKCK